MNYFQCNRCHEADNLKPEAPLNLNCQKCHQKIFEGGYSGEYSEEAISRWQSHIHHLRNVPNLTNISKRVRREWFEKFLLNPVVVRPNLHSMMPKLDVTEEDVKLISDYFYGNIKEEEVKNLKGDKNLGEKLFFEKGCDGCHGRNSEIDYKMFNLKSRESLFEIKSMAPNLLVTKERMSEDVIIKWLKDPRDVSPYSIMPRIELSEDEVLHLARYIKTLPSEKLACSSSIKLSSDQVPKIDYSVLESRIFKKICWHCHSDPIPMKGDGGPGNTGGLGFKGKGIDFSSYEALQKGRKKLDGTRESILADDANGFPIIIAHLLARHDEVQCAKYTDIKGMPLGLTPIPIEDIQLLYAWIKQGAKK